MPLSIAALQKAGVALDEKKLVTIESICAREILDSRGNPTVEGRPHYRGKHAHAHPMRAPGLG